MDNSCKICHNPTLPGTTFCLDCLEQKEDELDQDELDHDELDHGELDHGIDPEKIQCNRCKKSFPNYYIRNSLCSQCLFMGNDRHMLGNVDQMFGDLEDSIPSTPEKQQYSEQKNGMETKCVACDVTFIKHSIDQIVCMKCQVNQQKALQNPVWREKFRPKIEKYPLSIMPWEQHHEPSSSDSQQILRCAECKKESTQFFLSNLEYVCWYCSIDKVAELKECVRFCPRCGEMQLDFTQNGIQCKLCSFIFFANSV